MKCIHEYGNHVIHFTRFGVAVFISKYSLKFIKRSFLKIELKHYYEQSEKAIFQNFTVRVNSIIDRINSIFKLRVYIYSK